MIFLHFVEGYLTKFNMFFKERAENQALKRVLYSNYQRVSLICSREVQNKIISIKKLFLI